MSPLSHPRAAILLALVAAAGCGPLGTVGRNLEPIGELENKAESDETEPKDETSVCDTPDHLAGVFVDIGFHSFLTANCGACHIFGAIAPGAFADSDTALAYTEFALRQEKILEFAVSSNHKPPFTGPQLQPEVDTLDAEWVVEEAKVAACEPDEEPTPTELPTDPLLVRAQVFTTPMTIGADETGVTLSWNLAAELAGATTADLTDATFSLKVSTFNTAIDDPVYVFSDPMFSAGAQALLFGRLEVRINGDAPSTATTYHSLLLPVAANYDQPFNGSAMPVPFAYAATDTIEIGFGFINPIDDFDPTNPPVGPPPVTPPAGGLNFTLLVSDNEVFGLECLDCHGAGGAAGGLDMRSYTEVLMQVVPGNPMASQLYLRMIDTAASMPPVGVLPDTMTDQVRDWILAGAPE